MMYWIYWIMGTVLVTGVTLAGIWKWHRDSVEQQKFRQNMKKFMAKEDDDA